MLGSLTYITGSCLQNAPQSLARCLADNIVFASGRKSLRLASIRQVTRLGDRRAVMYVKSRSCCLSRRSVSLPKPFLILPLGFPDSTLFMIVINFALLDSTQAWSGPLSFQLLKRTRTLMSSEESASYVELRSALCMILSRSSYTICERILWKIQLGQFLQEPHRLGTGYQ